MRLMIHLASVPGASRSATASPRCMHRSRHGRHGDLGEPALSSSCQRPQAIAVSDADNSGVEGAGEGRGTRAVDRRGLERNEDEVVTRALSRDIKLPHTAGTAVLITLDNGRDHKRPNTLGPRGLGN